MKQWKYFLVILCLFPFMAFTTAREMNTEVNFSKVLFGNGESFKNYEPIDLQVKGAAFFTGSFAHPKTWGEIPRHSSVGDPATPNPVSLDGDGGATFAVIVAIGIRPWKFLRLGYEVMLPMNYESFFDDWLYEAKEYNGSKANSIIQVSPIERLHGPKLGFIVTFFENPDSSIHLEMGGSYKTGRFTIENGWTNVVGEKTYREEKVHFDGFGAYGVLSLVQINSLSVGFEYEISFISADYPEDTCEFLLHKISMNLSFRF